MLIFDVHEVVTYNFMVLDKLYLNLPDLVQILKQGLIMLVVIIRVS